MTWNEINKEEPIDFALVKIRNDRGAVFNAWWTGSHWDGYKKEEFGKIVDWQKGNNMSKLW